MLQLVIGFLWREGGIFNERRAAVVKTIRPETQTIFFCLISLDSTMGDGVLKLSIMLEDFRSFLLPALSTARVHDSRCQLKSIIPVLKPLSGAMS